MTPAQRDHLQAQLEALVFSRDPDLTRQGCELLVSLQDPVLLRRIGEGCDLTDDGRLQIGRALFGRVLPEFRALIGLQLAVALAGPRGAPLTCLRLPFDGIRDDGATFIATATALAGLEHLDLRGNRIRDPGAIALANSPALRRLRTLDLSDNHIEQKGALAIAAARLPLERLAMDRNRFGRDAWRALEAAYGPRLAGR